MKKIILFLFALATISACNTKNSEVKTKDNKETIETKTSKATIEVLTPQKFKTEISEKNIQLIDVRTPGEYNRFHLTNAININIGNLNIFNEKIKTLNKKLPTYVYCRSGRRSAYAAKVLKNNGFTSIKDLQNGIINWKKTFGK